MVESDHDRGYEEPIDPDLGPPRHPLVSAGLVAVGGAVGTATRALVDQAVPNLGGVPFGVLLINLAGAFLLALLLTVLHLLGPDVGRRQAVRLLCGTGLLGGFTTYSALAVDSAAMIENGDPIRGTGYAVITIVGGAALCAMGILVARLIFGTRLRAGESAR